MAAHVYNANFSTFHGIFAVYLLRKHPELRAKTMQMFPSLRLFCPTNTIQPEEELAIKFQVEVIEHAEQQSNVLTPIDASALANYEGAAYNDLLKLTWAA